MRESVIVSIPRTPIGELHCDVFDNTGSVAHAALQEASCFETVAFPSRVAAEYNRDGHRLSAIQAVRAVILFERPCARERN